MAVVDLELDSIGRGSVRINGQELSGAVRRVQVTAEAGQLTRVQLELVQIQAVTRYDADVSILVTLGSWSLVAPTVGDALRGLADVIESEQPTLDRHD